MRFPLQQRLAEFVASLVKQTLNQEATFVASLVKQTLNQEATLINGAGHPNIGPVWALAKDDRAFRQNIKNFGYEMARRLAAERLITPGRLQNATPECKPTRQADVEASWFAYWCSELKIPVTYHRKIWEYCYLLQTLHDEQMLAPGKKGIGFACGEEPIPSYLAAKGVSVVATDLAPDKVAGLGWAETGQHASSTDKLWHRHLVSKEEFDKYVRLEFVDMNAIPSSLGGFDFCWSICSLEHLGSIANGLRFIENSLSVLRPGGVAVHTTEYNLDNDGPTIDNWPTVLFQRRHFEAVAESLRSRGHFVAPLNFDAGDGPIDKFVDVPPYDWNATHATAPHLKLSIDGLTSTCFGMMIRKNAGMADGLGG